MKTLKLFGFFFLLILAGTTGASFGQEAEEKAEVKEKFNASAYILEHIADSHEWHIYTKQNGEHVAIYLPVILYTKDQGLNFFSSKKLAHGHEYRGFKLEEEGPLAGKIVMVNEEGHVDEENIPLDLSMTKTVVAMLSAAIIGLILFLSLARILQKEWHQSSKRHSEFP